VLEVVVPVLTAEVLESDTVDKAARRIIGQRLKSIGLGIAKRPRTI